MKIRPASPEPPPPAIAIIAGCDVIELGRLYWLNWARDELGDLQAMAERIYRAYPTFSETDLRNTLRAHVSGPTGNCLGAHMDGRHTWPCQAYERAEKELDAMAQSREIQP